MINYFREMRKRMLGENRILKFVLFTVAEIALIIIGILLAVQINSWNQLNKDKAEEIKLLGAFQEEFLKNKEDLIAIEAHYSEIIASNNILMGLIGKNHSRLKEFNTDSLMSVAINIENYLPSDYVLTNMISTGKLNLISSEELRHLLYEWTKEVGQKEEAYEMLYKYFMESLIPYLSLHASLKNIDLYTENGYISTPSELDNNSLEMFSHIVFENHLDNYHYTVTSFMESLMRLEDIINQILIETEIK